MDMDEEPWDWVLDEFAPAWVRRSTSARAAARAAESTRERLEAKDHLL